MEAHQISIARCPRRAAAITRGCLKKPRRLRDLGNEDEQVICFMLSFSSRGEHQRALSGYIISSNTGKEYLMEGETPHISEARDGHKVFGETPPLYDRDGLRDQGNAI